MDDNELNITLEMLNAEYRFTEGSSKWHDPTIGERNMADLVSDLTELDSPLDKKIEKAVLILRQGGVETYESCEGGPGHSYPEPTIRFHGESTEGFRAYAYAIQHGLPVKALRRIWRVIDSELTGPSWEMVFWEDHLP